MACFALRRALSQQLLKEAATSQSQVCRRVSKRAGVHFSQSRLSRALHGKARLSAGEKEALLTVLIE